MGVFSDALCYVKQIIDTAPEQCGDFGKKSNVRIAFHALPFGNCLCRDTEQTTEILLRQTVLLAVFADFLCNKNYFQSISIIQANTFLFPVP